MRKGFLSLTVVLFLLTPIVVFAQYGLDTTAQGAGLDAYGSSVSGISGTIIGSLLSMVGVIFFILTVYAGALWMTARGQEDVIKKAQNTLIAAVIGLTITIGSYAITNFIFQSADGSGSGNATGGSNCDNGLAPAECNAISGCRYYEEAISGVTVCTSDATIQRCEREQDSCVDRAGAVEPCVEPFAQCILGI